jgi:hypothetical protein
VSSGPPDDPNEASVGAPDELSKVKSDEVSQRPTQPHAEVLSPPRSGPGQTDEVETPSFAPFRRLRPKQPALQLSGPPLALLTRTPRAEQRQKRGRGRARDPQSAAPARQAAPEAAAPATAPAPQAVLEAAPQAAAPAAAPAPTKSKARGFRTRKKPTRLPKRKKRPQPTQEVRAKLAARKPPSPRKRPRQSLLETLHRSPAYGAAAFLHLLLLVALSFWTVAVHLQKEATIDARITPSKNVLPTDNLSERLDAQAAAEKSLEKALTGANSDSPFAEAEGEVAGALRGQASKVLGLAGGKGGGLGRGGSGGDSSGSRRSIHLGLDWLVRHRTQDGAWRGLDEDHTSPDTIPQRGGHVGQTGLALLAFLCANHGPDSKTPYKEVITKARAWLLAKVGSGDFNRPRFNHLSTYYERAIGTLALAEWLQRAPKDDEVREALVSCVKHLTASRDPSRGGWRYRAGRGSDTSVTSWVMLALKSARHAKVDVPEENFQGAKLWVERVTNQRTGTTGYVAVGDGRENKAMAATGLFLRILLGGSQTEAVNRMAIKHVSKIRVSAWRGRVGNLYEVYYGALAMYQVGGRAWRRFNPKIRDAMVAAQLKQGCERGGWRGRSWVSEPIAATCLAILTLETYYRYLPQHGAASASTAEAALDAAHGLLSDLEEAGAEGKLSELELSVKARATEKAFARAIALLEPNTAGDWDLLIEAYLGRARLFAREGELEPALAVLTKASALVPTGEPSPPGIAQLQRRIKLLQAIKQAELVIAKAQELGGRKDTTDVQRSAALDEIRSAARMLSARSLGARLDAQGAETIRALGSALDAAATLLLKSADRDAMIDKELARLGKRNRLPPKLGSFERRVILLLIQRAHERYTLARTEKSKARFLQGESDRKALDHLAPLRRGTAADRARLGPSLEQLELARVAGRVGIKDSRGALAAIEDYRQRFPQGTYREDAEQLERALLISSGPLKSLSDARKARLSKLLLDAAARKDPLSALEQIALGGLLLERGDARQAARAFGEASMSARKETVRRAAKLGRSRALRALGDPKSALAELNSLPAADNNRLDVIQERCAVLRAQREFEEAIKEYVLVLNAIEHEEPQVWWDLAEALARTYVEAKRARQARKWLEGLRSKDRTFGGDPTRRKRLIKLMREVDLLASRE